MTITVAGPTTAEPATADELTTNGAAAWILAAARELDDAILHLRFDEPELGTWVLRTAGDADAVAAAEARRSPTTTGWRARSGCYWVRTLKRLDVSARTLVALVEPGSCFAGTLAELALAADRTLMLEGTWEDATTRRRRHAPPDGRQRRLVTRWATASAGWRRAAGGTTTRLAAARDLIGKDLPAAEAVDAGLVTFAFDDLDWDDEVRLMLEERASFSPDALTGLEANIRFVGPETMETKIFARLSAWQNWIFQRPNAVGPEGALRRFGIGARPSYDERAARGWDA